MDDFERRVLNLRKTLFSETILINKDFLELFQEKDLLNSEQISEILGEKTKFTKWQHLLECLFESTPDVSITESTVFDSFLSILKENQNAKLAKELNADLRQIRGNIEIKDEIKKEASLLVHRQFGRSKRISEGDKRLFSDILALKMQIMTDDFYSHTSEADMKVKAEKDYIDRLHKTIEGYTDELRKFLKENEDQLSSRAHDMVTTTDLIRRTSSASTTSQSLHNLLLLNNNSNTDILDDLKMSQDTLMKQSSRLITHRMRLLDERKRACKLLGINETENDERAANNSSNGEKITLDAAIHAVFINGKVTPASSSSSASTTQNSTAVDGTDKTIKKLHKRRAELLNQLAKKDQKISSLEEKVEKLEIQLGAFKIGR